jgi:hypothetical protein
VAISASTGSRASRKNRADGTSPVRVALELREKSTDASDGTPPASSDAERRMRVKIYGGTSSQSGQSLCETCRHSMITRGRKLEEEIVTCEAYPGRSAQITFVVTECSAYMDAMLPSYPELFEKAWILRPRDGKRAAGFVRTTDLPEKERYELMKDGFRFEE